MHFLLIYIESSFIPMSLLSNLFTKINKLYLKLVDFHSTCFLFLKSKVSILGLNLLAASYKQRVLNYL